MVDLSSARGDNGSSTYADVVEHFDRSTLPVRYYFTDFSKAGKINSNSEDERLTQDIRDCAQLFDILLAQVSSYNSNHLPPPHLSRSPRLPRKP